MVPGSQPTNILPEAAIVLDSSSESDEREIVTVNRMDESLNSDILIIEPPKQTTIPNETCPICLDNISSLSFAYPCFHKFCKSCITSWHQVSSDCPVCKQKSTRLIYDIKTPMDYKETTIRSRNVTSDESTMFRTRLGRHHTRVRGNYEVPDMSNSDYLGGTVLLPSLHPNEQDLERVRQRRLVYRSGCARLSTYSLRRAAGSRSHWNKPQAERLQPWINREIHAILPITADYSFVTSVIVHSIKRYDLESPSFRMCILPFLGENTDIFIDELIAFNSSTLPMDAYDQFTAYNGLPTPTSSRTQNRLLRRRY